MPVRADADRSSSDLVDRSGWRIVLWAVLCLPIGGCLPSGTDALVIATTWPREIRANLETSYRRETGDTLPILWIGLGPGERASSVLDRRGGVDLIVGDSIAEAGRLARSGLLTHIGPSDPVPWRVVRQLAPASDGGPPEGSTGTSDPRDDPRTLSRARSLLDREGWPAGYETLVREAAGILDPSAGSVGSGLREAIALPIVGKNPERARRFLALLDGEAMPTDPEIQSLAEGLLADLLGAALVDAREELRDAEAALRRFGHPARAESALGRRPPWPPASVAKLQASPQGGPLLETLAEQIAPDPEVRAWLEESWSRPSRPIDGALLVELAGASEGRLAREPRFRAWLRGEWTAWTRQLYRRVARVAGGYAPS
ncbi:hypothetical protein P12x_004950 [Tundrisphaera lichenicola]|uniref:hypothetical protein n=1 Tax=Tundrisphaera lichenicola TaxID=2029860 RepID=UPI003EB72725